MSNKLAGTEGEQDVVAKIPCPNCGKALMLLPSNYPLYDVQCCGCAFRAQVKSVKTKPTSVLLGAGWEIIDKVLKSGFMIPPLIVNFSWIQNGKSQQEIRFFPFVPKRHLQKRQLPPTAKRANYKMFNYINLHLIPYFILYQEGSTFPLASSCRVSAGSTSASAEYS
ncbi:hypothetical protein HY523_01330 [Candidatus Berkelbacteria bacterium]|nr:hypothetical protein [Candidatus Berkelbacteria bacterium]